jgi:hypothetical protein
MSRIWLSLSNVNVPPGKSSTVCKLQVVNSAFLRALEALSVLLKKVFLITMPAFPPALSILIKCCKNKLGVKTVVLFFEKGKATQETWFYQLNLDRNLGKTNPLNEQDLAEFVELQKTQAESELLSR